MKYIIVFLLFCLITNSFQSLLDKHGCKAHRKKAIEDKKNGILIRIIPNCKDNGEYESLQCDEDHTFCQCWRRDGQPITKPSQKTKYCECAIDRDRRLSTGNLKLHATECQENGLFNKKQCYDGYCWCVNEETGEKIGEKDTC